MNFDELCREAPEKTFTNDDGKKTTYKDACFSCKEANDQQKCFTDLTDKFTAENPEQGGEQQEGKERGE